MIYTLLYVLPFYISPTTRPSPTLSRDAPSVIRARIRFVTLAVTISTALTIYVLSSRVHLPIEAIFHTLGLWPISLLAISKVLLLTSLLFAGPLFESAIVESGWRAWIRGTDLRETLHSWIGWRNYVAGPVTEEVLFRSSILALHLSISPPLSLKTLIFATPLYFGIAHVHHYYEYTLTHPFTPLVPALLRSLTQFAYTTVFGWYATFLYLRTSSLWSVILCHSFCNWMGLPRLWGRVGGVSVEGGLVGGPTRGKEDEDRSGNDEKGRVGFQWTVAYYVILVAGALAWWKGLWVLTENTGRELTSAATQS